jgi:hypothetical protein
MHRKLYFEHLKGGKYLGDLGENRSKYKKLSKYAKGGRNILIR